MLPLPFRLLESGGLALTFDSAAALQGYLDDGGLDRLDRHGQLALVAYLAAQQDVLRQLPAATARRLDACLTRERATALRWAGGLDRVSRAMAAAGVPAAIFKGADLSFHVYPEPGLRRMADIDVLVPLTDLARARAALEAIGFIGDTSCYPFEWYDVCLQQLPPMADRGGIEIDIHGRIVPSYSPFAVADAGVWSDVLPSRWDGLSRLGRPWAVWHLAMHAAVRHGSGSGAVERAVVDLLAMLSRSAEEPIDWVKALAIAERTGTAFALSALLNGTATVAGTGALGPWAARSSALARRNRWAERGARARHRVRHAMPFLGSPGGIPPGALAQFVRRPLRLLRARLARRP